MVIKQRDGRGKMDGMKLGRLNGGMGRNQTGVCRHPELRQEGIPLIIGESRARIIKR